MPFVPVEVSSKGSMSYRQGGTSPAKLTKDMGESSSHAITSPLNAANLLRISICFKSVGDNSKAFTSFAKTVTSKFDLFDI